MVAHDLRIKRISFGVAELKIARKSFGKTFSSLLAGGMRYAQKFFRINFEFYKFLFWGRCAQNLKKICSKIYHFF